MIGFRVYFCIAAYWASLTDQSYLPRVDSTYDHITWNRFAESASGMIAPAFCIWRFAVWAELKPPFDHPQSSLNPQGTVGLAADALAGASRIAKALVAARNTSAIRLTRQPSTLRRRHASVIRRSYFVLSSTTCRSAST